jgi:hypothetical protein
VQGNFFHGKVRSSHLNRRSDRKSESLAYLCLFFLGWFRFLPRPLALLVALLYPLHLYWSLRALRGQLNPQIVDRFQIQYRALYAVIGISMLCSLFYQ